METENGWHLDKKITISILVTLFMLFVSFVAQTIYLTSIITEWKTITDGRIAVLEKTDESNSGQERRIIILEQQWNYIREDLAEIKSQQSEIADLIRNGSDKGAP